MGRGFHLLLVFTSIWYIGNITCFRLRISTSHSRSCSDGLRFTTSLPAQISKARKSWSKIGGLVEEQLSGDLISQVVISKKPMYTGQTSIINLKEPQLLLLYHIPKEKSHMKTEMERLQLTYREQNTKHRFSERDHIPSKKNGDVIGLHTDEGMSSVSKFDVVRKSNIGSNQKRRMITLDEDGTDTDRSSAELEENEYDGDEGDCDDSDDLDSIPVGTLTNIRSQCKSIARVQDLLRLQYGVRVSVDNIKIRLEEEKSGSQRRRRGKSRKDRVNIRTSRHKAGIVERRPGVFLPASGVILVMDLAKKLELSPASVIGHLITNEGILVAAGQGINLEVARRVAASFGKKIADVPLEEAINTIPRQAKTSVDAPPRSPVVTIMGHVDHGKTTLLDRLRRASVAASEVGGITQSISAFSVSVPDENGAKVNVTFIDTPGHAAFRAMRTRGAHVTDIIVLVVAADDGVMEQTKECISAARDVGCPLVVAINKMDKEGVDATQAVAGLLEEGILLEEFGGETQCAHVSAKTGAGLDDLLDKILMQAEIMDLRAPIMEPAIGTVLESRKDRGLGLVVSAIVRKGTLSVGDYILAGQASGRIRRLMSDQGISLQSACPSTPVQIVGLSGDTCAGDTFSVVRDEFEAKETVDARERIIKSEKGSSNIATAKARAISMTKYDDKGITTRDIIKIPVVIKCDVAGSAEAVVSALESLEQSDDSSVCSISVVHCGVGEVTSSDIASAAAFNAKVIAFNVGCASSIQTTARQSGVDILHFGIIYELINALGNEISRTLVPPLPGVLKGRLLVKKIFKIGKSNKVVGCELLEGQVNIQSPVRVMRNLRQVVHTGNIASIRIAKDAVDEVNSVGKECGVSLSNFSDLEEGDIIECFVA